VTIKELAFAATIALSLSSTTASAEAYCDHIEDPSFSWSQARYSEIEDCIAEGQERGRDINALDDEYSVSNFLIEAFKNDAPSTVVELIIDSGGDLNVPNKWGIPAFAFMIDSEFTTSDLRWLLDLGADVEGQPPYFEDQGVEFSWVYYAINNDATIDVVKALNEISETDFDFHHPDAGSLHHANLRYNGIDQVNIARFLIDNDASLDIKDNHGFTPAELAREADYNLIADLLDAASAGNLASSDKHNVPGLATADEMGRACYSDAEQNRATNTGASLIELCGCVLDQAPVTFERISAHPDYEQTYGRLDQSERVSKLIDRLMYGCAFLWSREP
jgi:hypothetical protein